MQQWMRGQNKSWTKPETENMSERKTVSLNLMSCAVTFIRKPKECDSYLNVFNQGKEWL